MIVSEVLDLVVVLDFVVVVEVGALFVVTVVVLQLELVGPSEVVV